MFISILIFLLLVNPVFSYGALSGNFVAAVLLSLTSIFLLPNRAILKFNIVFPLLLSVVPLVYYSIISLNSVTHNFHDFIYISAAIVISFVVVEIMSSRYGVKAFDHFMKILVFSVIIWSLVLIFEALSSSFKGLLSIIFLRSDTAAQHLVEVRSAGFHPSGGDGTSLNLMLLAILSFFYLTEFLKKRFFLGFAFLLLALSASILAGRSGAFVGVITILILSFYLRTKGSLFLILTLIGGIAALFVAANTIDLGYYGVVWGWEHPIIRMLRAFSLGPYHSDILSVLLDKMLVFPGNTMDLFFGTGEITRIVVNSVHIYESDLGIVRIVNGIGIVGWLLVYGVLLFPTFKCLSFDGNNHHGIRFLIIAVSLFVFFSDFKIIYSLTRTPWVIIFCLYFFSIKIRSNEFFKV